MSSAVDDDLLAVRDLIVRYSTSAGPLDAVAGISFHIGRSETLGLVGESGCGKSSVALTVMQLRRALAGSVVFEGTELTDLKGSALRRARRRMQLILQDPASSLNPNRTIRNIVAEPFVIWGPPAGRTVDERVDELLEAVALDPATVSDRRPHQLSGGQCQRVSIARALATQPSLLVCDEPVSSLDVSVQARTLNLLEETKRSFGVSMLFIGHDLGVVRNISDRIAVMYLGKICEMGPSDDVYKRPTHPYSAALIDAVPDIHRKSPRRVSLTDEMPSPLRPPSGCRFRTRCDYSDRQCEVEEPMLRPVGDASRLVACHHPIALTIDRRKTSVVPSVLE